MYRTKTRAVILALALIPLAGSLRCNGADGLTSAPSATFDLGKGKRLGDGPAEEHSGIVRSRNWADVFWMHNDTGDEPRI